VYSGLVSPSASTKRRMAPVSMTRLWAGPVVPT
jgi:hypothetical protein